MAGRGKGRRNGMPVRYGRNQTRSRTALLDEDSLQERSRRLAEQGTAEWKPSSLETQQDTESADRQETRGSMGWRGWLSIASWTIIVLSVVGFFVLMWLPTHPFWLVLTVSIVFGVGVLSLFIASPGRNENPRLDENGTAL